MSVTSVFNVHPAAFLLRPKSRLPHLVYEATIGSFSLRPAQLLFENSRPRVATTPLSHATGVNGQLPGRDFNPQDLLLLLRTVCPPIITSGYARICGALRRKRNWRAKRCWPKATRASARPPATRPARNTRSRPTCSRSCNARKSACS
jgi:hypothetical protein